MLLPPAAAASPGQQPLPPASQHAQTLHGHVGPAAAAGHRQSGMLTATDRA